jgi:ribose 5-phosphate isomerase B
MARIVIGSDHRGYRLKEAVRAQLESDGHTVVDCGTDSEESADYPDHGSAVARAVAAGDADFGITACWTGNGMNIVANKVLGIRAAMGLDAEMARLSRAHNDANVLTLAAMKVDAADLPAILDGFINTAFEGGRHAQRVDKIMAVESERTG